MECAVAQLLVILINSGRCDQNAENVRTYMSEYNTSRCRRRCYYRRVYRICSDAQAYRPAFWDADFMPVLVYFVVFCDKRATQLCACGIARACREFAGQRWRLQINACVHRIDSIEHKSPIFTTKKRKKEREGKKERKKKCHPKEHDETAPRNFSN